LEELEFRVRVVEVTNSKKSLSKEDKDVNKVVLEGGDYDIDVKIILKSEEGEIKGFSLKQGFLVKLIPLDQKLNV
jgi:uncharacterized protein with PhoU and TrkA domain